jgi:hypothetical protein
MADSTDAPFTESQGTTIILTGPVTFINFCTQLKFTAEIKEVWDMMRNMWLWNGVLVGDVGLLVLLGGLDFSSLSSEGSPKA